MVLILSLLSFGEKAKVRRVCRKLKQAVEWMFGQQSSVRIVLRPEVDLLMEDCGWKSEQMCDHTFDPGYDFSFTHYLFQVDICDIYLRSEDAKQVVDRFIGGIRFVMKYFHEASVIAAVCGYMEAYFLKHRLIYYEEDGIRMKAACGELAARFGSQAKCMIIPMLDIDQLCCFPELVHLTCDNISSNITNVFESVAPKLTALNCDKLHIANYRNLPHGFRSIWTFTADEEFTDTLKLIRQSEGRDSIRRIRVRTGPSEDVSRENSFPHLQSLGIIGWGSRQIFDKFPDNLTVTSKRLQRMTLYQCEPIDRLTMDFDCLQSLVLTIKESDRLTHLLGKTPQLQQLCVRVWGQCPKQEHDELLSALSLLPHLRFVDIRFSVNHNPSEWPDRTAAILTFLRGPLRPHLTFCRFDYGPAHPELSGRYMSGTFVPHTQPTPWQPVQEVVTEMQFMTRTQKLVAGSVNYWLVRRGYVHAIRWTKLIYVTGKVM